MTRTQDRSFGRHYVADERDAAFRFSAPRRKASKRTSRYWRSQWWSGDQRESSACVGFSWAHWLANYPVRQYLDPYGVYHLAQHLDEWEGTEYDGTSVRAGAKVLHSLGFISEYRWATTVDALVYMLLELGPVVVGTEWFEGMNRPRGSSAMIEPTGVSLGGHAYLLNGVNTQKGRLRVKNSWGLGWGVRGHASIEIDVFGELLSNNGECCLAIERSNLPV